jgi:hypothetical protein
MRARGRGACWPAAESPQVYSVLLLCDSHAMLACVNGVCALSSVVMHCHIFYTVLDKPALAARCLHTCPVGSFKTQHTRAPQTQLHNPAPILLIHPRTLTPAKHGPTHDTPTPPPPAQRHHRREAHQRAVQDVRGRAVLVRRGLLRLPLDAGRGVELHRCVCMCVRACVYVCVCVRVRGGLFGPPRPWHGGGASSLCVCVYVLAQVWMPRYLCVCPRVLRS